MKKIFIGIGSNLGNPQEKCVEAIKLLNKQEGITVTKMSSLYKTAPVGYTLQDWFVNAAVEIETNSGPEELLGILKKIELEIGRKKTVRLGPREIDLDILFYNDRILKNGDLEIPHSELHRRRFVLIPLNEIAGGFIHPIFKESVFDLLKKTVEDSSQQVEYLDHPFPLLRKEGI